MLPPLIALILMQARSTITADDPYRPLFVELRHDRCAEVGVHVFVVGRRRCLCGEVEAFAAPRSARFAAPRCRAITR